MYVDRKCTYILLVFACILTIRLAHSDLSDHVSGEADYVWISWEGIKEEYIRNKSDVLFAPMSYNFRIQRRS